MIFNMGITRIKMPTLTVGAEDFGKHLASIRKKCGFTQVELAKKMGTIQANISAYEKNKLRLNGEIILRFAEALKVSSDEILGYEKLENEEEMPLKLTKRMKQIQSLPKSRQKLLLRTIDGLLKSYST